MSSTASTGSADRPHLGRILGAGYGNIWFEGITGYEFGRGKLDRWISGPDRSMLAILDASDLSSGPVATVELPQRVPFGFHAAFHR